VRERERVEIRQRRTVDRVGAKPAGAGQCHGDCAARHRGGGHAIERAARRVRQETTAIDDQGRGEYARLELAHCAAIRAHVAACDDRARRDLELGGGLEVNPERRAALRALDGRPSYATPLRHNVMYGVLHL
jgi:hypothetical protein